MVNGYRIYERINFLAKKRKISIKQIAEKAGFRSPNAIYRYKQGVTPREQSINAIAEVLQTTPEYLKGETDDWIIHYSENKKSVESENEIRRADLTSPILALVGKEITGDQAEQIREYAKFLISQEEKKKHNKEN